MVEGFIIKPRSCCTFFQTCYSIVNFFFGSLLTALQLFFQLSYFLLPIFSTSNSMRKAPMRRSSEAMFEKILLSLPATALLFKRPTAFVARSRFQWYERNAVMARGSSMLPSRHA